MTFSKTYCKICKTLHSQYVPIKLLTANKLWLLFTYMYNVDSIRDLTKSRKFPDFYGENCYFPLFSKYCECHSTNVVNKSSA